MARASNTYVAHALILSKTKLGETDLIVTGIQEDGSLLRVVARGARKPKNSFSARLELASEVRMLIATGKKLDYACEVALISPRHQVWSDFDKTSCASVIADLLRHLAQDDLPQGFLFKASKAYFSMLDAATTEDAYALTAAHLIKLMSAAGFRPSLQACVCCGAPVSGISAAPNCDQSSASQVVTTFNPHDVQVEHQSYQAFSYLEGGLVCSQCRPGHKVVLIQGELLAWAQYCLSTSFVDICKAHIPLDTSCALIRFAHMFLQMQLHLNLKSIDFLLQNRP